MLDTIATEGLLEHVDRLGKEIRSRLEGLGHPLVGDVSGAGLHIGVGLTSPVSAQAAAVAREAGFLINNATPERLRLAPALTFTDGEADEFLAAASGILDAAAAEQEGQGN